MPTHETRILSTTINVPFETAYGFAHKPENFPKWASGLSTSLEHSDHGWEADTPGGRATVSFAEPNKFGVLDHRVQIAGKPEIYIPLRMIANGSGTEVELVLFRQPEMSDADFSGDAAHVEQDLASLKRLLEG